MVARKPRLVANPKTPTELMAYVKAGRKTPQLEAQELATSIVKHWSTLAPLGYGGNELRLARLVLILADVDPDTIR